LIALLAIPTGLPACQCLLTLSACNEVAVADRVFIGRWNRSSRAF